MTPTRKIHVIVAVLVATLPGRSDSLLQQRVSVTPLETLLHNKANNRVSRALRSRPFLQKKHQGSLLYDSRVTPSAPSSKQECPPTISSHLEWVNFGISWIYLSHFSSLYSQLPGLFGQTGLLPVAARLSDLVSGGRLWALHLAPGGPEFAMESFTALGIAISITQVVFPRFRIGLPGVLSFGLQWILWHDLVASGGRFMSYQMDTLLLDAAPLTVLASSGLVPDAVTFGYRWLLSRLYLGAGAVKFLSFDESWRNLSAVHWHFQSQPLPNPIGSIAYAHLPDGVMHPLTLAVLVAEMAVPYVFLAPSRAVRRIAFVLNVALMVGIALFGNFGPLQALLGVIGLALLDDLPPAPGMRKRNDVLEQRTEFGQNESGTTRSTTVLDAPSVIVSSFVVALAAGAGWWALENINIGASCSETLAVAPLVYDLLILAAAVACLPLLRSKLGMASSAASVALLAGSAVPLAGGLGVPLPFADALNVLNIGSSSYGLFAIMTGVGGRPVAAIEAAASADGPWTFVPFLYQVNDPSSPLPFCFPHFPRLDWTLWFVPLGEKGRWLARLLHGVTAGDPDVLGLLDKKAFYEAFPERPPDFVRITSKIYELGSIEDGWKATDAPESPFVVSALAQSDLFANMQTSVSSSWPSLPYLRDIAETGRPEYFIWGCIICAEIGRRIVQAHSAEENATEDFGNPNHGEG